MLLSRLKSWEVRQAEVGWELSTAGATPEEKYCWLWKVKLYPVSSVITLATADVSDGNSAYGDPISVSTT